MTENNLTPQEKKEYILNNLDKYIVDNYGNFFNIDESMMGNDIYYIGKDVVSDYEEIKEEIVEMIIREKDHWEKNGENYHKKQENKIMFSAGFSDQQKNRIEAVLSQTQSAYGYLLSLPPELVREMVAEEIARQRWEREFQQRIEDARRAIEEDFQRRKELIAHYQYEKTLRTAEEERERNQMIADLEEHFDNRLEEWKKSVNANISIYNDPRLPEKKDDSIREIEHRLRNNSLSDNEINSQLEVSDWRNKISEKASYGEVVSEENFLHNRIRDIWWEKYKSVLGRQKSSLTDNITVDTKNEALVDIEDYLIEKGVNEKKLNENLGVSSWKDEINNCLTWQVTLNKQYSFRSIIWELGKNFVCDECKELKNSYSPWGKNGNKYCSFNCRNKGNEFKSTSEEGYHLCESGNDEKCYYQENSENTKPLSREMIKGKINKSGSEPKNENNGMLIFGLLVAGAIIFVLVWVISTKKEQESIN